MAKEKRKNEATYTLKTCPICGETNLEWGVVDGTSYRNKLLSLFRSGKAHTVKALRCLKCDTIVQMKVDRELYQRQTMMGCLAIVIGFASVAMLLICMMIIFATYFPSSS